MAGVGLQTLSSVDQRVQVDTNNRTLLLLKSGQYTASESNTISQAWRDEQADITGRLTAAAILCVRVAPPGIHPSIGSMISGKRYVNFHYLRNSNVTFQYYIYDNLQPSLQSRLGLQSFDANGNLIYDAWDYPMKMIGTFMNGTPLSYERLKFTAPHSNIAVANLSGGFSFKIFEQEAETWSAYLYMKGNQIFQFDLYDDNPTSFEQVPYFGNWGGDPMNCLVIDTTNVPLNYTRP